MFRSWIHIVALIATIFMPLIDYKHVEGVSNDKNEGMKKCSSAMLAGAKLLID